MFTHYEDMKGDKNTEIEVVWGLGVTQGHQQHSHAIEHYGFLFDFNKNYVFILYLFRVIKLEPHGTDTGTDTDTTNF